MLVSPGLHPACDGAATLRDGRFPQHHPIFLDFRIEGALWKTQDWKLPRRLSREQLLALNAEDLSDTFLCACRDDSRAAGCGDGFHKWAKAVETCWTKALAASDPHVRMKASQRGRCGPVTLKSKPAPKRVKTGKVGDFEPCGEPFSVRVKQVTRQARSGFVWDERSSVPLLKAICDARGFGCSFQSWLSSVGGPVLIQDELSAENLQVTLQLTCDFATTSGKRETSFRQERFAEALKHSICAQGGKHVLLSDAPSGFRFCRAFTPPCNGLPIQPQSALFRRNF